MPNSLGAGYVLAAIVFGLVSFAWLGRGNFLNCVGCLALSVICYLLSLEDEKK